jgi:hypothetical protein
MARLEKLSQPMEKTFAKFEELTENVLHYVNVRIDALKLQTAEKTASVVANFTAGAIAFVIFVFFLFFSGIAASLLLGELTGRIWLGFLIVSLLYLLAGFVIWKGRKRIIALPVLNALLGQLFKKDNDGKHP